MTRKPGYPVWRSILEQMLEVIYAGNWPAALWGLLPAASRVSSHRLQITNDRAGPLKLGFVSDIHVGPTTSNRTLDVAAGLMNRAAPDVLLLGGDFVYLGATDERLARLGRFIAKLDCSIKLAVLGNHDRWTDHGRIVSALEEAGVRVLINEAVDLPIGGTRVVGLDDAWTGHPRVPDLQGHAAATIVLSHSPDGLLHCDELAFDLFLCGHTHGGMIASPWGPIVVPRGRLSRGYSSGVHAHRGRPVVVSRGIGGVEVPIRVFAPPDLWIIEVAAPTSPHTNLQA